MTKKKNAGFSIVEILIALAIFLILMMPIVKGIITSLNNSTSSKELQYRNEFAESMVEHIKSSSVDDIRNEQFYINSGTVEGSFVAPEPSEVTEEVDIDGDGTITTDERFKKTSYEISGTVALGTKGTEYNYLVQVDNGAYVGKKISSLTSGDDSDNFVDPNNLSYGIVESLDYKKVALFDGAYLDYDGMAAQDFQGKKLLALKETNKVQYDQQMEGEGVNIFLGDEACRLLNIQVSGSATEGYVVRCVANYLDESGRLGNDNYLQYTVDASSFTDKKKVPNIYLMYNPCFYNYDYMRDDYIVVDTSGLSDDDKEVNVFIVELAETYSEKITSAIANQGVELPESLRDTVEKNDSVLYRHLDVGDISRDQVRIHLVGATTSSCVSRDADRVNVYTNIGDNTAEDGTDKVNMKSSKDNFLYASNHTNVVDASMVDILARMNDELPQDKKLIYYTLENVGPLSAAKSKSRGLYDVKMWMKKAKDGAIDTSSDTPILEGTKGGSE